MMTKKYPIEITVSELGAIITDRDNRNTRLLHKRRGAKSEDRAKIDEELLALKIRTSELEAYFDAWTIEPAK